MKAKLNESEVKVKNLKQKLEKIRDDLQNKLILLKNLLSNLNVESKNTLISLSSFNSEEK